MSKKLSNEEFIAKATIIHGNKYDYSKTYYLNSVSAISIICRIHGSFSQKAAKHLQGKGCKDCRSDRLRKSTNDFIAQASIFHNGKYDYSQTIYRNNNEKVSIRCPTHGQFWQRPTNHLQSAGCRQCGNLTASKALLSTTQSFINKALVIHGSIYDYSLVDYNGSYNKVKIICSIHGAFEQRPNGHLLGKGCQQCIFDNNRMTKEEFVDKANIVHNNKYTYEITNYATMANKIIITCLIHGAFEQFPSSHLSGSGCAKCSKCTSKIENEWLDSLEVLEEYRQKSLKIGNKRIKADAYNPITNTVYEFNGDFWHGNPERFNRNEINQANHKTFGELYDATIEKEWLIKKAGYKLITIWENDFRKERNKNEQAYNHY